MRFLRGLFLVCSFAAVFCTGPDAWAVAKKEKKAGKAGQKNAEAPNPALRSLRKFDANKDGELDSTEKEALRAAFKSGDADLKTLDTNGDGELDENEMAALSVKPMRKDGKPAKGKGVKKPAAAA
jgi:hypothetical protein